MIHSPHRRQAEDDSHLRPIAKADWERRTRLCQLVLLPLTHASRLVDAVGSRLLPCTITVCTTPRSMTSNFASYASHLLSQSTATTSAPLFYSTRDVFTPAIDPEDDILGASASLEDLDQHNRRGRQLSFGSLDDGREDPGYADEEQEQPTASLMGVPAFMSRLSAAPARFSRGWRAHESVAQHHHQHAYLDDEDSGSEFSGSGEESSPPGAFLSTPLHHAPPNGSTTEPLIAARTLFVYPVQGQAAGRGVRSQGQYRDSHWIVIYGLSCILVLILGVVEWWKSPKVRLHIAVPSPKSPC